MFDPYTQQLVEELELVYKKYADADNEGRRELERQSKQINFDILQNLRKTEHA